MSMMTIRSVLRTFILCLFSTAAMGQDFSKSICGADERELSTEVRVGRVLNPGDSAGCSVTLISKDCAITAGHCTPTFGVVEFNTPPSVNGRIQNSRPEDTYTVDKTRVEYVDGGVGNDFALIRLLPNEITGLMPGDTQGFYPVAKEAPLSGDTVRITGYGADYSDKDKNFAQQTHTGPVTLVQGSSLYHRVDTMGGNSGSAIINEATGEIVGIHTHGGCSSWGGENASTLIVGHPELQAAIASCLADSTSEI